MAEPKDVTRDDCLQTVSDIEEGFKSCGVTIRPNSDIALFIKDARWLADHINSRPDDFTQQGREKWVYSFLRRYQAKDIARTFNRLRWTKVPQDKMRILKGRLDILNKEGHSQAPDILFELEVAGRIARQSPDWDISFEEPDIVLNYPGGRIAFACKNSKSEKNISKLISYAAKQGKKSGIPFFIILATNEILRSHLGSPYVHVRTNNDLHQLCEHFLGDLVDKLSVKIASALTKGAGGVILSAKCAGLVDEPKLFISWWGTQKGVPNIDIPGAENALKLLIERMAE